MTPETYGYDFTLGHPSPYGVTAPINVLAFSCTGQSLLAGDDDGFALVYDIKRRKVERRLEAFDSPITACLWHPKDPQTVLIGSDDATVVTIRFRDSRESLNLNEYVAKDFGGTDSFISVHRMSSGRVNCIVTNEDGTILFFNHRMSSGRINSIVANEDGTILFVNHGRKITKVATPSLGIWEDVAEFPGPPPSSGGSGRSFEVNITSLHYLISQEMVIATYRDHGVIGYDVVGEPKALWRVETPAHCFRIGGASLSPFLDSLVTVDLFRGFDFYQYTAESTFGGTLQHAYSIVIDSLPTRVKLPIVHIVQGGRIMLACGSSEGGVKILDAENGDLIQHLDRPCHDSELEQLIKSRGYFSRFTRGKVQVIACAEIDGSSIIATSACANDGSSVIDFWSYRNTVCSSPGWQVNSRSLAHPLINVLWAAVLRLIWVVLILVAFVLYLEFFRNGTRKFMLDVAFGEAVHVAGTVCRDLAEIVSHLNGALRRSVMPNA